MRLVAPLAALALFSACAPRPPAEAPGPTEALVDVWAAVPAGAAEVAGSVPASCDLEFKTWFTDFGVRGIACAANQKLPLAAVTARGPGDVWVAAPHAPTASGLGLDLQSDRDFGRYDPAFVRWAVDNAVPESDGARTLARPIYERHVRRLARVYWLSLRRLTADGYPDRLAGGAAAYAAYLDGGPVPSGAAGYEGGVSVFSLFEADGLAIAEVLTRPGENEWVVRYEANTALGFWVRRRADGTADAFRDGLRQLLAAFDGAWLAAHSSPPFSGGG